MEFLLQLINENNIITKNLTNKIMKNLHLLPTDKPSRLIFNSLHKSFCYQKEIDCMYINDGKVSGADFWSLQKALNNGFKPQNIYITSDEEIKEGDWCYGLFNGGVVIRSEFDIPKNSQYYKEYGLKIILTTDQDLIKDGVQAIDDEFLEWFVKNPSCEEVEVESGLFFYRDGEDIRYKIIIPKQEPKKVLTEEDIFNQKDIDAVTDYINKEQQKQHLIDMMESDEELELYDESREIKLKDVFNDDKKANIKKFIDEIINPSQPNQALKDAAERLKGRELFKESNDRARKILSEIKSLPIQDETEHMLSTKANRKILICKDCNDSLEDCTCIEDTIEFPKQEPKQEQERSYSEEEVIQLVSDWTNYRMSEDTKSKVKFKEWFEQFKKK